jgi:hypothetical protein
MHWTIKLSFNVDILTFLAIFSKLGRNFKQFSGHTDNNTQHNDIQHNNTQDNDKKHEDIQHDITQHNVTEHYAASV